MTQRHVVAALLGILAGAGYADELNRKDFLLLSDKPVYQAGKEGKVVITLTNKDPKKAVTIGASSSCRIKKKGMKFNLSLVRSLSAPTLKLLSGESASWEMKFNLSAPTLKLLSGQSASWEWDKKDSQGKLVSAGNYLVVVGPLVRGNLSMTAFQWIALTPTGQLAGNSWFPLSVGNTWHYHRWTPGSLGLPDAWRVKSKQGEWYWASDFLGVKSQGLHDTAGSILVKHPYKLPRTFTRFDLPSGQTFSIDVSPYFVNTTLKVASVNEKVVTPAGVFEGCVRFDVVNPVPSLHKYRTLWFARGVGLVQYRRTYGTTWETYSLIHAWIGNKDGSRTSIGVEGTLKK